VPDAGRGQHGPDAVCSQVHHGAHPDPARPAAGSAGRRGETAPGRHADARDPAAPGAAPHSPPHSPEARLPQGLTPAGLFPSLPTWLSAVLSCLRTDLARAERAAARVFSRTAAAGAIRGRRDLSTGRKRDETALHTRLVVLAAFVVSAV